MDKDSKNIGDMAEVNIPLNSFKEDNDHDHELPVPAQQQKPKPKLSAATIIPIWMSFSAGVIIYNKYIYSGLNFKYPIFLPPVHLCFAVSLFVSFSVYDTET